MVCNQPKPKFYRGGKLKTPKRVRISQGIKWK